MTRHRIALYGAAGHTGRLVAAELQRRGFAVGLGGRDPQKLADVAGAVGGAETDAFDVADADRVATFISGASVVVNCAGPFAATAAPLVAAAIAQRVHYVDVTGEPPVLADLIARFDRAAKANEVVVLPAAGFFGALPDLLATAGAKGSSRVDDVIVAYALSDWKLTRGSQNAAAALAGRRHVFCNGSIEVRQGKPPIRAWQFPPPIGEAAVMEEYPAPEAVTLPWHLATRNVRVLMTLSTIADVRGAAAPETVSAAARAGSTFTIDVALDHDGAVRRAHLAGRDIYGITAAIVTEAVIRLTRIDVAGAGVLAAGQAFPALSFLDALPALDITFP